MSAAELRPMGIGDILDATFRLYRARFVSFLAIALLGYVPLSAAVAFLQVAVMPWSFGSPAGKTPVIADQQMLAAFATLGLMALVFPLCQGALIVDISASFLGEPTSALAAYRRSLRRYPCVLGCVLLISGGLAIGLTAMLVPGIIAQAMGASIIALLLLMTGLLGAVVAFIGAWAWLLMMPAVVILEHQGVLDSLARAWKLLRGHRLRGLLLGLVAGLLGGVISLAIQLSVLLVAPLLPVNAHVTTFVATCGGALALPITTAPMCLLYYDLRIRKEAFDLQALATAMGLPTELASREPPR